MKAQNLLLKREFFELGPLDFQWDVPGVYLISGPNGSGKSTLLRALAHRYPVSEGQLEIETSKIGSVGVESFLFSQWSLKDNLHYFHQMASPIDFSDEAIRQVERYFDYRLNQLSQGWRKRTELACIFSSQFFTILLDEPLNFLDPSSRRFWLDRIQKEAQTKQIIIGQHDARDLNLQIQGELKLR